LKKFLYLLFLCLPTHQLFAQQIFPNKPITIVVPFAAGGGTDLLARYWGQLLQKEFGQTFLVDVKPGAGGLIGTRYAAQSVPDGYTLLIATPAFALNPFLIKNAGYDPLKDFQPIAIIGISGIAIVVANDSPIKNIQDLIESAKKAPNSLMAGNAGQGSAGQLAAAAFQAKMKIQFTEVTYKGAAPAVIDLIGGRTDVQFEAFPSILTQIKAGKVRAIAVTLKNRSSLLPNIETVNESNSIGFDASSWTGLMAPTKTPKLIIERLNKTIQKLIVEPEVIAHLGEFFGSESFVNSSDDATAFVREKLIENEKLLRTMNVKPQ
jgi:tripartite-type tricarboxylate transporter receptor subunit TctC